MIAKTDIDELRGLRARNSAVISLYLNIPVDLAEHRGLATRVRELLRELDPAQTAAVTELVTAGSHDWLGQTVAIFGCAELELSEAIVLPGRSPDLAVIAPRPYLRPLLASRQRHPAYQVAVLDARHAWVLAIADGSIDTLAQRTGRAVSSTGFAGWYGLEAYRMQQRVMQLAQQHFKATIAILEQAGDEQQSPLVLGGHDMQISRFRSMLPPSVRQRVAGTFSVDLQSATPARVRELSAPVIADWAQASEAQLVDDLMSEPPGTAVTTSLGASIAAVRSRAVSNLVVADDQVIPGFACEDCGKLGPGSASCDCPGAARASRPVPDVLDDLASQALDGGSEVTAVRQAPFTAAARLRFQLP